MKKTKPILILLICTLFVAGCTEQKILERISITTLLGYDLEEEDKVTTTLTVRQVSPDDKSSLETQSNTEETSNGTSIKVNLQTSKKIMAGQLRVLLFGKKLAQDSIEQTLHTTMMNSEISSSIYLAVADGTTKEIIEAQYENITDIGQHVFNLIDHNVEEQHSVSSTLHEVVRNNYSPFRDIAMPIIKKEGQIIKINGLAIFNKSKMVGELSSEDAFYVIMLRDKFKAGSVELSLPGNTLNHDRDQDDKLEVSIDSIKSKRSINLTNPSTPEFDVTVDFGCRLIELHSNENTGRPEVTKKLEKAIGDKMESEISRIIKYTQEKNSDIFGFGDDYYASVRNSGLTEAKWHQMYPNMKVNVKVNIEIFRNGVFE
ncbi:spore germination protein [Ureibacillus xyleni]|uniref:Spore germination protein n=1 Tax=Ureibacillus xyleni TaxID=614648 RepID=A0A285TL59_9BACL|nr:Ger(x)C family spore germination protein [Ureibacillus xyleni]SOC22623.1 spore germination protein [Ureibacillus xyleni]